MTLDQQLDRIRPYFVAGWRYDTSLGFYVHRGRVYIVGAINASIRQGGSATILSGLPAELRPTSPIAVKTMIDHTNSTAEYAPDGRLHIGPFLDSTMHADGTWTFDAGNPFAGNGSSEIAVVLSTASWPTLAAAGDAYPRSSLAPYVDTAANQVPFGITFPADPWVEGTGTFSAHGTRMHLDGTVIVGPYVALGEQTPPDQSFMLIGVPLELRAILVDAPRSFWTEMPTSAGYRAGIDRADSPITGSRHYVWISSAVARVPGNAGCGFWENVFYDESDSANYVRRGSNPTVTTTLGTADAGVSFRGLSGSPVSGLASSAVWTGNTLEVEFSGNVNDLGTATSGSTQFCCLLGLDTGVSAYYKLLVSYQTDHTILASVYRVTCGGSQTLRNSVVLATLSPGSLFSTGVVVQLSTTRFSGGTTGPGPIYLHLSSEGSSGVYFEDSGSGTSTKGNCAIHVPSGGSLASGQISVNGVGTFPGFVPGDVVDLTGCGWPLAFDVQQPSTVVVGPQSPGFRRRRALAGTTATSGATSPGAADPGGVSTIASGVGSSGFVPPPSSRS